MEWLINRRRMMFNKAVPPAYLTFEDTEFWRICCEKWGDYNEIVITDNGDNTVNIVTTFKSMLNTSVKESKIIDSQLNVDNSSGVYIAGTTKEPIGITKKQCSSVTNVVSAWNGNTTIVKANEFQYFTGINNNGYGCRQCFRNCTNLTNVTIPDNLNDIEYLMFAGSGINSIDLKNVKKVSDYAFSACSNLTGSIVLKEGASTIGNYSFRDCPNISYLEIPSTMTSIGDMNLMFRNGIVICKPLNPPTLSASYISNNVATVYVPDDSYSLYTSASGWSNMADRGLIKKMSEYI